MNQSTALIAHSLLEELLVGLLAVFSQHWSLVSPDRQQVDDFFGPHRPARVFPSALAAGPLGSVSVPTRSRAMVIGVDAGILPRPRFVPRR